MKFMQRILNKFNGLAYKQEYLCLAHESFKDTLHVYLIHDKKIIEDITCRHLFVGYHPLIFALLSRDELPKEITIIFSQQSFQPNDFFEKKDAMAELNLKLIRKQTAGDLNIFYYEATQAKHRFLSSFHQYIIGLHNRLYNKKPGNVFLKGNLYKQVQIAYSVPRIISLITVGHGESYNLFPTDLHGPANEQYYISSLRHEGKACEQVASSGKIAISTVNCEEYKTVYSLGKNHMQPLRSKDNFPFGDSDSSIYRLPLPRLTLKYTELEAIEFFIHDIHKIFLYKIVSQQALDKGQRTLAHIHNVYATWRHNKGLAGNYLFR